MRSKDIDSRCDGLLHAINKCNDRDHGWKQDMKDLVHSLKTYYNPPNKIRCADRKLFSESFLNNGSMKPLDDSYRVRDLVEKPIHIGSRVAFYVAAPEEGSSRMCIGTVIAIFKEMNETYKCRVESVIQPSIFDSFQVDVREQISTDLVVL